MNFLVMGAGSIGSVVGGFLHLGGHSVFLLGKGPHTLALKDRGLEIAGIWGWHLLSDIPSGTSLEELKDSGISPEWVLLCVKSYDTEEALSDLSEILPSVKGIISLQNGLGNLEAIENAAPKKAVGGRVIFGARTLEPGKVEVTVCADDVLLGPVCGGPDAREVVTAFRRSDIPCRYEENILAYIYDKVLYNCCLNALATILRCDYGTLASNDHSRKIIGDIIREFYAATHARCLSLVSPDPESYEKRLFEELIPATKSHRSSMQEDIECGRRTEIDALNQAVVEMGSKLGIETPVNRLVSRMIRFLEERAPGSNNP